MEKANLIGIDETLVSELVETFYRNIQNHDMLRPVFLSTIDDGSFGMIRNSKNAE